MSRTKISIVTELNTLGKISNVRNNILKEMPDDVLFTKSEHELCFYILSEFDFPQGVIASGDINSLEAACRVILGLMGITDDFEDRRNMDGNEDWNSQLDRFIYYFLDFKGLPGFYKERLESEVRRDLNKINAIIADYQKIDFINASETPRNHKQRTQSDFYNRCLTEKLKIENHLENGINERAINKARRDNLWGLAEMMVEEFRDRPYKLPMPRSIEYFDLEKIDKVGHRLGEIPISKGRELKTLYKEDKAKFYSELEKLMPDEKILQIMQQQVDFLPFIPAQRKAIFRELVNLYKSGMWFGFYALALTQIEGLFTEMCKVCKPGYNSPFAALPDKVNTVRPFHPSSESRFDYFQYHLPNLRNRFLHFGLDPNEKIEILCKELLWDLTEVVSIFSTLDIDALWLLRLIRKRDDVDFMTASGLCFYFKLLGGVKTQKQFEYFEEEVNGLNESFLPDVIYNVVFDLDSKIDALVERIYEPIKILSKENGFEVDLKLISFEVINDNKDKIKPAIKVMFTWQFRSEIEDLVQIHRFLTSYQKYIDLKFIPSETQTKIVELNKKYGDLLKRIKLVDMYVK